MSDDWTKYSNRRQGPPHHMPSWTFIGILIFCLGIWTYVIRLFVGGDVGR